MSPYETAIVKKKLFELIELSEEVTHAFEQLTCDFDRMEKERDMWKRRAIEMEQDRDNWKDCADVLRRE